MSLYIRPYSIDDADAWDDFSASALQATFLHTRRFLSYHGDRFHDCSLIIEDNGKWVGLFPAALSSRADNYVVSHPGISYGDILHRGSLRGSRMVEALTEIIRYYRLKGFARLIYKAVPTFYHLAPAQDDIYALFRLGAIRTRCDLSSAINLQRRLSLSERRRRSLKKARHAGVQLAEGFQYLSELWVVLAQNLDRKHGAKPVHSLSEIMLLADLFPKNIRCICAKLNENVVAGIILFVTHAAYHVQYIASSEVGYEKSALDMLLGQVIEDAVREERQWFDFGICTENYGTVLNDGLYRFKTEFGGGGFVHEFYEIDLILKDF